MTEQPFEPDTEQDWLGNVAAFPTLPPADAYLKGHRLPVTELSSIAKLDILEANRTAAASSAEALALMRTRLNTATLLHIAEKESTRCEEALKLALAVEDQARARDLHAAEAINEFARKQAGA